MAVARPILGLVSIVLLAGGILLQFLVILSGATNSSPENQIYFLQSTTHGITGGRPNIPDPARWTYFALCGVANGRTANCYPTTAALPFDPPKNFDTTTGVPDAFIGTHYYYYMSRFAWAFYIIALFFAVVAFFMSIFALCARLAAYLTGFTTGLACFFQTLTAALMTAWTVKARDQLRSSGQTVKLGVYAYAFTWTAFACFFISMILFCVGGSVGKGDGGYGRRGGSKSYFGRKKSLRSTRSRGSFVDSESGRRGVKEEYE